MTWEVKECLKVVLSRSLCLILQSMFYSFLVLFLKGEFRA